jgi:transcriptional accessory protein Tex/SPT6
LCRAENEKQLNVKFEFSEDEMLKIIEKKYIPNNAKTSKNLVLEAIED